MARNKPCGLQELLSTSVNRWLLGGDVVCLRRRGIQSYQSDHSPPNAEIRTLNDCYRLVGLVCEEDPVGTTQTHPIPNTASKVTIITTAGGIQYSRHSHIPVFNYDSIYCHSIHWTSCASTGEQPTQAEKLVILGGHVGLLDGKITTTQCECITPRVYPVGVARHALRAAQNHFQSILQSESTRGRAWGYSRNPQSPSGDRAGVPPNLLGQGFWSKSVIRCDRMGYPPVQGCDMSKPGIVGDISWWGDISYPGFGERVRIGRQLGRFHIARILG